MLLSTIHRLIICAYLSAFPLLTYSQTLPASDNRDTLRLLADEEERRTMDPLLKRVPYERLDEARQQLNRKAAGARTAIPNITWQERGPSNVGGRTRALLFDPNDATHKKVWAGSPSGGLWYTSDITDSNAGWTPVSDSWENMVVTALAADPSNPQVMYAGTGDGYGYITGGGIWKTTNGGTTWARLSSTIPGSTYPSLAYGFGYIQRIVVTGNGYVFAATRLGIFRSTDGGTSWQYALAPNQGIGTGSITGNYYNDMATDLELATDGVLYASFNPSRVFKSTNTAGTTWTEITPTGASGGERTELALAQSTSGTGQIIYGISRKYNNINYAQDISWFKKSSDGGVTWTNLTIPTLNGSSSHFTNGNGDSYLNLSVDVTDPNRIYAGSYGWYTSTDAGASWSSQLNHSTQQGIWFKPGSTTSAILASDGGVLWFADWINLLTGPPTIPARNKGYRVGDISSVSMKGIAGSSYLMSGIWSIGFIELTTTGISAGNQLNTSNYAGMTLIDQNEPEIQIIQLGNSFYRYSAPNLTLITSINSYYLPIITSEYDSQSNILYIADYINNQTLIKKVIGVSSTPQTTTLVLAGINSLASYIKLNSDRTKLFLGTGLSKLYRITNLDQSTHTVTAIDNGAFPQYSTIACIDIGANDDELLVTLSNYGVQSVWYTTNGGITWISKDQNAFGLPDVPVRSALFNLQNHKQVLLGTDAGIWSTGDITAANPAWGFSGSSMGAFRINQLRYRESDGRIAAATNGRGVWMTDAFTPSSVAITSISNTTLCAGNTFTVSFSTAGPAFGTGNTFEVWLSDANGSFSNPLKIGSSITSPISATLPGGYSTLPYGTNYKIKIIATNPDVESSTSNAITIGNLGSASVYDRRMELSQNYSSGTICLGSRATLKIYPLSLTYTATSADMYQWFLNGSPISDATSATISAQQSGTYTAIVKQGGCSVISNYYRLSTSNSISSYIISSSNGTPQCNDQTEKLATTYIGETAIYQWTKNGIDVAGANSYTYSTNQTGSYSYRMIDGGCSSTAPPISLKFSSSLIATIYMLSQYNTSRSDSLLCEGYGGVIFADVPISSNYTIQWYRDGSAIAGANSNSYTVSQPGLYSLMVKQGSCQTFSNAVVIRQSDQINASIISSFSTKLACPGEKQSLIASPSINASFQWQRDGVDILGATQATLVPGISGDYTVRITRGSCSVTSPPRSLTFSNAIQPSVYSYTGYGCTGLSLTASGLYDLSGYQYQWYRNGVLVSNAVNRTFFTSQSGLYSVRVTNGSCTGLSKESYISVGSGQTTKPVVYYDPPGLQLCSGNSLQLSAYSYNGNLQWKRDGVAILEATGSQFYATQSGIYTVVNQDGSCTAESDPVEVKIGEPTTASLGGNALISNGQSALLPVSFTGPAPWSFTLSNGQSVTATYQNPTLISVAPASTTTYQLASVGNACGLGTVSGQASVSVGTGSADVSLNMIASTRTPNVGDVITYTLAANNTGPDNAQGVQLSSILPTGLSFVSTSSLGVSYANGIVSANLGSIPANNQSVVSFQATPIQPGVFVTSAQISGNQTPDPDSQPNSGTGDGQDDAVTVDIRTPIGGGVIASANPNQIPLPMVQSNQPPTDPNTADLSLRMWVDQETPTVSDIVTTSLTVTNRGGSTAASIIVQVTLPNGTFSAQSPIGWIQVNSQTYKIYINSLAAGKSSTVFLKWQPAASGSIQAQILDTDVTDPDSTPGNGYTNGEDDTATVSVRVR